MTPRKSAKPACECLGISEAEIVAAIREKALRTVRQVTACTEAGGGCTACHPVIREYLARENRVCSAAERAPRAGMPAGLPA